MPTISRFLGILIAMYWREHGPPHFHARYGEHEATVYVHSGEVWEGQLPTRVRGLVKEWAQLHQSELSDNWDRCAHNLVPNQIDPLE